MPPVPEPTAPKSPTLDARQKRTSHVLVPLSDFKGPRRGGYVAPTTLFSGFAADLARRSEPPLDVPDGT